MKPGEPRHGRQSYTKKKENSVQNDRHGQEYTRVDDKIKKNPRDCKTAEVVKAGKNKRDNKAVPGLSWECLKVKSGPVHKIEDKRQ